MCVNIFNLQNAITCAVSAIWPICLDPLVNFVDHTFWISLLLAIFITLLLYVVLQVPRYIDSA